MSADDDDQQQPQFRGKWKWGKKDKKDKKKYYNTVNYYYTNPGGYGNGGYGNGGYGGGGSNYRSGGYSAPPQYSSGGGYGASHGGYGASHAAPSYSTPSYGAPSSGGYSVPNRCTCGGAGGSYGTYRPSYVGSPNPMSDDMGSGAPAQQQQQQQFLIPAQQVDFSYITQKLSFTSNRHAHNITFFAFIYTSIIRLPIALHINTFVLFVTGDAFLESPNTQYTTWKLVRPIYELHECRENVSETRKPGN